MHTNISAESPRPALCQQSLTKKLVERAKGLLAAGPRYAVRLYNEFGPHFLILVFCAYFGVKGLLYTLIAKGMLPYFKDGLGISGEEYQRYFVIALTPWGMKALMGITSDAVPILGLHKLPYMLLASSVGASAFACLAAIPFEAITGGTAAFLFFCGSLELAVVDLLIESKYAQMMRLMPETGSDIVTFVWLSYATGTLAASAFQGPVADHLSPRVLWAIALPFSLQILIPLLLGYLPEERLPKGKRGFMRKKIQYQPSIFGLALLMGMGALVLALLELVDNDVLQLCYSLVSSVLLVTLGFWALPWRIALCNAYVFLLEALYVQIEGAQDYFYTAGEECAQSTPGFSYTYYITYTSIVGSAASWVGTVLFQVLFSTWPFRRVFWLTTSVRIVASTVDIFIATRTNTRLGIPDKDAYMLGDAVVGNMVYMLNFMPAVVLTSKLCPASLEATVYALLAGFQNFGQSVAKSVGISLIKLFTVSTESPCDFSSLPMLIFVSHFLLPLVTVPLTFFMIPNARLDEEIDEVNFISAGVPNYDGELGSTDDEDEKPDAHEESIELLNRWPTSHHQLD